MSSFAVETESLRKEYTGKVAVRGISLQVRQGEAFGFLGPNGAGKTTFIKMLLGLIAPTSGAAHMLGLPLGSREARRKIGFLPEHFRFHDWLTAAEFLTLHGNLYGIPSADIKRDAPRLLERVGLAEFSREQLRTFSKGMLQRVGLAQALLNRPSLVFLDEPTSGLDPVGRILVRDIIRELRESGSTIFLNSHFLSEVEVTCDRVAFIKHGEVIRTGELKSLTEGETSVQIRAKGITSEIVEELKTWVKEVHWDGEELRIILRGDAEIPAIVDHLVRKGLKLYSVVPQHTSLEELFVQIVGTDGGL